MVDNIYSAFGVSPNDYEYDPSTNTIRLKPTSTFDDRWNLPSQPQQDIVGNVPNVPTIQTLPDPNTYGLPVQFQKYIPEIPDTSLVNDYQVSSGVPALNKLFGLEGERFQTWPERMARSGATAPGDAYAGRLPIESPTGYPGSIASSPIPSSESEIARVQDLAGMAGMSGIGMTPKGALGTSGSNLRPELLPKKPLSNHMAKIDNLDAIMEHIWNETNKGIEPPVSKVDPNNLIPTQEWLTWKNLGKEQNPDEVLTPMHNKPTVVEVGDKQFIIDGHHRVTGAIIDGSKNIDAHVYKFSPDSKAGKSITQLYEDTRAATGIGAINQSGFYSNLERTIANSKVDKATPEQWTSYLKNQPGIKSEELEFGLGNLPDKVLSKTELEQHIAENGVKLGEVWKGGEPRNPAKPDYTLDEGYTANNSGTKYSSYQLPGGQNYRELLLTVPQNHGPAYNAWQTKIAELKDKYGENFYNSMPNGPEKQELLRLHRNAGNGAGDSSLNYQSSHWDEPNVLAHIRMNDRDIPNVGKSLHIEEVQSDIHQQGRKEGYRTGKSFEETEKAYEKGVPNFPFKKSWDELALKRALTEAVKGDYQALSWTPGEAQAARYDLSKHINSVEYGGSDKTGNNWLTARDLNDNIVMQKRVEEKDLSDHIGKEAAEKLLKQKPKNGFRNLENADLKIGGEGMKAFYDKMLMNKADNIVKKMGGKVEYENLVEPKKNLYLTQNPNGSYDVRFKNPNGEERVLRSYENEEKAQQYLDGYSSVDKDSSTKIPLIRITPQMREKIKNEGFPLFTAPVYVPIDHDPFERKLTKVDHNPFIDASSFE